MGLFDKIIGKIGEIAGNAAAEAVSSAVNAVSGTAEEKIEPEMPKAFGWDNAWLAVKAASAQDVMQKLGVKNAKPCGWKDIAKAGEYDKTVFVTEPIKGYVLVIGVLQLADHMEQLGGIAAQFEELQFFATQGTVDLHCWAKYENGSCIRRYSFLGERGEVLFNDGVLTDAEIAAGMDNLIAHEDDDWETVHIPSEDDVLTMARLWSVDPTFEDSVYEPSVGFLGEMR